MQAFCLPLSCTGRTEALYRIISMFYKTQMYISAWRQSRETPWDAVDLCLSFTSAGMSERDSLPVVSENKSDQFRSNSGQLHFLHPFVVVLVAMSVLLSPKRTCFIEGIIVSKRTKMFFPSFSTQG